MFQDPNAGDRVSAIAPDSSTSDAEDIRLIIFGCLPCVRQEIHRLHAKGSIEASAWSRPVSTGRPKEVMVILVKRCRLD
ncbi:MAG: hypothetical protein HC886_02700 [Leptolyngbyaceae cyanobacterium SM1_1_3]|nr:hypothetical protein [Leptolyngbyaceae cyanobacterium SM1_1_3]NJN01713.1 hypothetical protein [Leptolyngbyaceae cyanobacterium RM1_1_2]NJO09374.1 hypothetical protein [Leptolyngbyaceae cyanobacterium SL_1_1]